MDEGGKGAELEPAGGADVGEAEDVDEEVCELGEGLRPVAQAADGCVVLVWAVLVCGKDFDDCGFRWYVGERHVGERHVGERHEERGRVRVCDVAVDVCEEEEHDEKDKDVGCDSDRAVRVWGEEGVGDREDGDGGPEERDGVRAYVWSILCVCCVLFVFWLVCRDHVFRRGRIYTLAIKTQ